MVNIGPVESMVVHGASHCGHLIAQSNISTSATAGVWCPEAGKFASRSCLNLSVVEISSPPDLFRSTSLQKIRDLDYLEEMLWLFEQNFPLYHVLAVEVEGSASVDEWRAGLSAVQRRYPHLSACIRKEPGKRPYFARTEGVAVPLRVEAWTDKLVLPEEMEKELDGSFGDGNGPLVRVKLFHGQERSALLLSAHHSAFDGKSSLLVLQDLLASMAGEDIGEMVEATSLSSLFGETETEPYTKILVDEIVAPKDGLLPNLPKVQVKRLVFSKEETTTLIERAKREGTTVHSALIAALASAGARYSKDWPANAVRCQSPVDVRRLFGVPEAAGVLIPFGFQTFDAESDLPFWVKARAARESLAPILTKEHALNFLNGVKEMVAEEIPARKILELFAASNGHEIMVTNYAGYKLRTDFGRLQVNSVFTGSIGPAQKVSVITVNGRLGMTLVNMNPFPTLLEDAREILFRD
jgi:hypothetical protein